MRCAWSSPSRDLLAREVRRFRPDVVHVHNFFPLLSPSIYEACAETGVPVVQTLHNYRIICPGALLMRGGRPCEECVTGSAWRAVRHGCYRDSRLATLPVAYMVQTHRARGTWHRRIDRFIALTRFARAKFVEAGLPAARIVVKPNFVEEAMPPTAPSGGVHPRALLIGRLSREKGVHVVAQAWKRLRVPLQVAGAGPMENLLRGARHPDVTLLGHLSRGEVATAIRDSSFVVLPSIWYEGFPLVVPEAFSAARPIVASRIGGIGELVEDGRTGLLVEPGDPEDLARKVAWMARHPTAARTMGQRARDEYLRRYTPEINYRQLARAYREVLARRRRAGARTPS